MFSISKRVSFSNWNIKSNVGVRNLNATHKKYLFRSLYPTQRTPSGVLFALAGALVASKLAPQAKRRGIRFAFAACGGRGWRPRQPVFVKDFFGSSRRRPLRSGAERANHGAKRSYPSAPNGQSICLQMWTHLSLQLNAQSQHPISRKALQSPRFYDTLITGR